MTRRRVDTLGDLAAGAGQGGRRVVCSVGALDGPFLAALAKLQPIAGSDRGCVSTWVDGIGDQVHQEKVNDGADTYS